MTLLHLVPSLHPLFWAKVLKYGRGFFALRRSHLVNLIGKLAIAKNVTEDGDSIKKKILCFEGLVLVEEEFYRVHWRK
jgi:hypothetical protein